MSARLRRWMGHWVGGCVRAVSALAMAAALAGCGASSSLHTPEVMEIAVLGFNDFHGNLEPPRLAVPVPASTGASQVPAGGAAYFAGAVAALKAQHPHHLLVSAGDMVGASPLVSALFLDEPTIHAFNLMGVDFHAPGNHEFDKGWQELLRLQRGGCEKFTVREPCQSTAPGESAGFAGAQFPFLTANTLQADGSTLLPATGLKRFSEGGATITVGLIGLTLRATPQLVNPAGVAGLRFADEADTVNALIPGLRAQGADVIVVVLHEGGSTRAPVTETSCDGLSGDIVPIVQRLDPAVDVVVSGHTHQAYVCDYGRIDPARPLLLTSAGQYGTLLTHIQLGVDTRTRRVVRKSARQVIVQGQAYGTVALHPGFARFEPQPQVQELVQRYRSAAQPLLQRPVGQASGAFLRTVLPSGESVLGNLVADAQLAATQAPEHGGAQVSFMHAGGLRADLVPDEQGLLRYQQLFAVQPFGNSLEVRTYTGAQLHALLEQQFDDSHSSSYSRVLSVSQGLSYRYDLRQPPGQRVQDLRLHGVPIEPTQPVRAVMSSFLAAGGSGFSVFTQGQEPTGGGQDIDALEAYFRTHSPVAPSSSARIQRIDIQ